MAMQTVNLAAFVLLGVGFLFAFEPFQAIFLRGKFAIGLRERYLARDGVMAISLEKPLSAPGQVVLRHAPLQGFEPILTEERFVLECHQRHAPVTGAVLRRLTFDDDGFVAVAVRHDIAIEVNKIKASACGGQRQMIAEMPIARAAENDRADFFQEFEALAAFGSSDPSRVSRPI